MPRPLLFCFLFIPFIGSAQQSDSAIVSQLNRNWIASYATRDTATMQQLLAEDFVMVAPHGKKLDRKSIIHNVGSTEQTSKGTIDSASVRVFGNTALVVAYTHFSTTANGKTDHGKNCYSDLYIKRNGVWKAIAAHVTVLNN